MMKIAGNRRAVRIICNMAAAFVFLSVLSFPSIASAQSAAVSSGSASVYEELSSTVINCMLEDSGGFLWFGTQTGLYQYNGYDLKRYGFRSERSNQFSSNFITAVCEDGSGNIWTGTFGGGLFKLSPKDGTYENFYGSPQTFHSLSDNFIRAIVRDGMGRLWIGTQNKGVQVFDPVSGGFTRLEGAAALPEGVSLDTATALCVDKTGALWIGGAGGGLNRLDLRSGKVIHYGNQPAESEGNADNDFISAFCLDSANILWIVTRDGGLNRFDTVSERFLGGGFPELKDLKVTAVCEDRSGALWIGTYGGGVQMLDKTDGTFTVNGGGISEDPFAGNYRVVSLFADSSGNLWIGTEGSGVDRINTDLNFISYRSKAQSGVQFSDDVILSIYKDKSGILWIGTANGGVSRFDRKTNKIDYYKHDAANSDTISSNAVTSIYEDSRGALWFGTVEGTLDRLDPGSDQFIHYRIGRPEGPNMNDNGILRILEDREGLLWLCAANGGLVRFDRDTGDITQFSNNPADPYSISSNHVLSAVEDDAGILWIGTAEGGLNRLDTERKSFTRYNIEGSGSNKNTLNYSINTIIGDGDILWLATDIGLYQFYKNSGRFVLINGSKQISDNFVLGMIKDERGSLWLSISNGLVRYNIPSSGFKKYDFGGGLQKNQYITGAYHRSSDGEIFFGGTNGFSSFYPDKIRENTHTPPVVITDFRIFDNPVDLSDSSEILLSYRDKFISFEFAALDYAEPAKNQYAYKLEGFDSDWHYSGTRNYANYTNLNNGEYVLRVKAANNDGLWNETDMSIKIAVTPPFWETLWFTALLILTLFALIVLWIKIRERSIKQKNLELERQVMERTRELDQANEELRYMDEMKSNFLSMVSHEIRTPLSAILGFAEVIGGRIEKNIFPRLDLSDRNTAKTAEKITRDLNIIMSEGDRLSVLIGNLLNISKIESGETDLNFEEMSVYALVEQSLSATKSIVEKAGLAVYTEMEADLPQVSGDRDMLTEVIINLISNAVKFTTEGCIRISAADSGDKILFSVKDTGIGIKEENLSRIFDRFYKAENAAGKERNSGAGLGLCICRQIIEKHGGAIWAESQYGEGSTINFTIPHGTENNKK